MKSYLTLNIGSSVNICPCSAVSDSFVTPWTATCQAPLSMGFSRQEYWSVLPFAPQGDLPNPGIEPTSPLCLALVDGFFTTEPPGNPPQMLPHSEKSACQQILLILRKAPCWRLSHSCRDTGIGRDTDRERISKQTLAHPLFVNKLHLLFLPKFHRDTVCSTAGTDCCLLSRAPDEIANLHFGF